jgi:hypothetical protein
VEHGVASPIWKSDTGSHLLIRNDTGTRTQNAPIIPCIMTNLVYSIPLKNPMKQNRKHVRRQSMAYAFR